MADHESKDGTGAGARDSVYTSGNPRGYLTVLEQARLQIMKGVLRDVSHAPISIRNELRYGGDTEWTEPSPSGLHVPISDWVDGS